MSLDQIPTEELARELARRQAQPRLCASCNTLFTGPSRRIYCSRPCKDRAFYLAHSSARNAATVQRRRRKLVENSP